MPLWRVATAPDELDAGADALAGSPHGPSGAKFVSGPSSRGNSPTCAYASGNSPMRKGVYNSPFLISTEVPADINKNTSWFSYPGIWSMYFIIILLTWLLVLSTIGCDVATAWVIVNVIHCLVTFYFFHWKKGSPFSDDQGVYDKLTWWEQMDGGRQLTRNRKFLTLMPVMLFAVVSVATRHQRHSNALLLLNTIIVFVLVIAKLPLLHKVRIFGINSD